MTAKRNIRLAADNEKSVSAREVSADAEARAEAPPEPRAAPANRLRRYRLPLMLGGVLLVAVIAAAAWLTGGRYQGTEDAYVRVAAVGVSSRTPGRVTRVLVHENQRVKAGDILFTLDSEPAQVALEDAAARLANARLQLASDQADYRQKAAALRAAQAEASYREGERVREQGLMQAGAVSRSEYEAAANAAVTARQRVAAAEAELAAQAARLGGSRAGGLAAHPEIRQASAAVQNAELQRSYTVVRAPQDGVVTKVDRLQVGDYVNASQRLFNLVTDEIWVEAAFKENQLAHMRPGQKATIKVDAYPGHEFTARIESIAPGTDQTFSVLPAENASGNWVKVVQRVPVRLVFTKRPDITLQGGLSAHVKVDTEHRRFGGKSAR